MAPRAPSYSLTQRPEPSISCPGLTRPDASGLPVAMLRASLPYHALGRLRGRTKSLAQEGVPDFLDKCLLIKVKPVGYIFTMSPQEMTPDASSIRRKETRGTGGLRPGSSASPRGALKL